MFKKTADLVEVATPKFYQLCELPTIPEAKLFSEMETYTDAVTKVSRCHRWMDGMGKLAAGCEKCSELWTPELSAELGGRKLWTIVTDAVTQCNHQFWPNVVIMVCGWNHYRMSPKWPSLLESIKDSMRTAAEKKIKADYEKLGVLTHEREVGQKSTRWKGERWTRWFSWTATGFPCWWRLVNKTKNLQVQERVELKKTTLGFSCVAQSILCSVCSSYFLLF